MMPYSELSNQELFTELDSRPSGLTEAEAGARLRQYGPNEIVEAARTPMILRLAANFYQIFALLLWVAGILAFVSGTPQLGIAIIAVIVINALFSFWQEYQAEKAVEALKRILPARTRVIRDGNLVEVPARDLVRGDVVVLQEGDNVSVDGRLIEENELRVNAATLTGESEPVRKVARPVSEEGMTPSEVPSLVLAGTSVAFGSGKAVVYATGMATEFGKIASLTQKVKTELSPLQKEVNRIALIIAIVALAMGAILFGIASILTSLTIGAAAIFAIGLLVANVPEGLLPTVTLSLAMAVKRMVKKNALVKRLSGVETLGSTSVICTDKTGTLTQNEMTVRQLWANGRIIDITGAGYDPIGQFETRSAGDGRPLGEYDRGHLDVLMRVVALCNNARLIAPDKLHERWSIVGDPTEAALLVAARKWGLDADEENRKTPRIHELPFESRRKRMSVILGSGQLDGVLTKDGKPAQEAGGQVAFVKGAPREMLQLCTGILENGIIHELAADQSASIAASNDDMARQGLRVLAMAFRQMPAGTQLEPEQVERDMVFVGLMAMMDPPRVEVEAAVKECQDAGIRVIMITGDYGLTAESVARRIGLLNSGTADIINGADLEKMTDEKLAAELRKPNILFARVSPEHKMRIAAALRGQGYIVAMTGDGVNDAPALKRADIGVAMGITGTDVAKEAATIVLTDDNFATIVAAVEEGRVVFENMKKFLSYIFVHAPPEVIPFVAFVLFGIPLPLAVMQILAIDLGTDTLPALALGVERAEPDIMERPPRKRTDRLVDKGTLLRSWVFLGLLESGMVMAGFFWVLYSGGWHWGVQLDSNDHLYLQATTMTWAGIVASQMGTGFACRTNRASVFRVGFWNNRWLLMGIVFELSLLLLIVYVPPLQSVFDTAGLELKQLAVLAVFPVVMFFSDELRKLITRRFFSSTPGGGAR